MTCKDNCKCKETIDLWKHEAEDRQNSFAEWFRIANEQAKKVEALTKERDALLAELEDRADNAFDHGAIAANLKYELNIEREEVARLREELRRKEQVMGVLCDSCGWAMKFPDEPCRCELEKQLRTAPELRAEVERLREQVERESDSAINAIADNQLLRGMLQNIANAVRGFEPLTEESKSVMGNVLEELSSRDDERIYQWGLAEDRKQEIIKLKSVLKEISERLLDETECDCPPEWPRCTFCSIRLLIRSTLSQNK